MSFKVKLVSAFAVAASMMIAAFGATDGAAAQSRDPIVLSVVQLPDVSTSVVAEPAQSQTGAGDTGSLEGMVAAQAQPARLSPELQCLAGAIYFEAKSQALAGQLAVGRVVINRAKSGRFPASYCGVVYQRAQFGFVHGSAMPAIALQSRAWRTAVAVAQIADAGAWPSETEGALYFHATRVAPNWHMVRIARLEDHVFYR